MNRYQIVPQFNLPSVCRKLSVGAALLGAALGVSPGHAAAEDRIAVARNTLVGAPDTTFSADGQTAPSVNGALSAYANAAVRRSDGKVIAVGTQAGKVAIVRYTTTGTVDYNYFVDIGASSFETATSVAIDSSGRVVVGGSASINGKYQFLVIRLNTAGVLDTGFGSGGIVLTDFASTDSEQGAELAIQSNGKIVLSGTALTYNANGTLATSQWALARYQPSGLLDTSFDVDGKVLTLFSTGRATANGLAIDSNGKIIVAGSVVDGSEDKMLVARYTTSGALDSTFTSNGKVLVNIPSSLHEYAYDVIVDSTNRVYLGGSASFTNSSQFAMVRLTTGGLMDGSFDTDGIVLTNFTSTDYEGIASLSLRRASGGLAEMVVAGGYSGAWMAGARYKVSDGALDTTFDGDGKIQVNIVENSDDSAAEVLQDSAGNVILVGGTYTPVIII